MFDNTHSKAPELLRIQARGWAFEQLLSGVAQFVVIMPWPFFIFIIFIVFIASIVGGSRLGQVSTGA